DNNDLGHISLKVLLNLLAAIAALACPPHSGQTPHLAPCTDIGALVENIIVVGFYSFENGAVEFRRGSNGKATIRVKQLDPRHRFGIKLASALDLKAHKAPPLLAQFPCGYGGLAQAKGCEFFGGQIEPPRLPIFSYI